MATKKEHSVSPTPTTDEYAYGLRNLSVMDEEQTRIGDYEEGDLPARIYELAKQGDYERAYVEWLSLIAGQVKDEEIMKWWNEEWVPSNTDYINYGTEDAPDVEEEFLDSTTLDEILAIHHQLQSDTYERVYKDEWKDE